MSNKPTKVLFKRNSTANTPPTADKLVPGEIAINTADGKLFTKTDSGTVIDTGKQIFERNTNVTVNDNGTDPGYVVTSVDGTTKLTIDPSSATLDADLVMVGGRVISLHELATNGTNKVNISAPDNLPLDYTLKLPQTQGTAGQVMAIGENGQMEFVAPDRFGGNRVYVSADRGDDANDGINAPVATVKRAAQIASELIFEATGTPATGAANARAILFKNKEFIKAETAAWIDYNYVNFDSHYNSTTCSRDIGLIVDAVSYDLITGSNFASSVAGMAYYRIQSGVVTSRQLIQTIEAITYAKTLAVTYVQSAQVTATNNAFDNVISILSGNGLPSFTFPDDAHTDTNGHNSAATLQANRTTYQTSVSTYLDTNYHTLWTSLSAGQQLTCKRDVGYIVDAVTYDILYGGNYQSVIAGNAYYSFGTLEIAAGEKTATLAAYNYLKTLLQADVHSSYSTTVGNLITNITTIIDTNTPPSTTYPSLPGSGTLLTSFNALQAGKSTIQSSVITHITSTFSSFTYGTLGTTAGAVKSARDTGLILDGAIFDMYFGGNEKSREYGLSFYNGTATYLLANEKTICVQALTYAKSIAQKIVTNTLVANPYQTDVAQVRDSVNYGTSGNASTIGDKFDIAIGILANGASSAPTLDPGAYRIRGVSIRIAPGNYFENNPIIVPDACSIIGDDLRSAVIRPLNANKDIFRVRNGVYMNGFTFRDHVTVDGVPDYTWRYTHSFDDVYDTEINRADWTWIGNGMPVIAQSPYVQNCSIISFLGGSGMLIDGSKVKTPNIPKYQIEAENPAVGDTPEQGKSMVGNAYTMLSFGGTGWHVINNAYSQIVGCFQIFLLNGIYAQSGGYISVTNSATNFGTFALRSSGYSDKSFTFDRGIIAANGAIGGAQTLTIIGTQRVPLVQYVLRFFNPSNGADITNSYKSSPTVVPFNAATALTLGSSVFTISGHGFFTGNSVYYSRNGNAEISGLSDNGIYYVQVANINQFVLYNDDSFKYPVTINAPGTGTQQLIKNPEEFYVNDIASSHTTYQRLVLAGSSYTFVPGRAISATVDIYQANAYVYSWNSSTRELIISNELTNINGSDERVLFTTSSTINQDHAPSPATAIVIASVSVQTGLTTAVIFPHSTIEGGTISSIGGLPEKNIAFHRPSIVNSSAHTWEYAGSGTDYNALPQNGGVPNPVYEQYSEAPGRVYVSGTNELGDFKVGNFITAENRSGLITFKSKVTVGELNVLKLTLSAVQINQISADVGLGDNEPGGASNQRISTQKAVRSFLANRLGSVIDKGVSTNSVPGSLVQLNASGQINADLLPPQKAAITYQVGTWNGRLSLYNQIPPVDIGISDQANEKYYQQTLTLSNSVSATIGQVVTQTNRTGRGVVKYVVSSSNQVTIANSTGTFSTNSIDTILFDGVDSGYYPTSTGTAVQQSETYYLALDNKSQFLLVDSGSHSFTIGNTVTAAKNLATGAVTEYRQGVLYGVNNTGINGGAGYQPGSGSQIYLGVPLTSVTGSGTGAKADITVTSGAVTNVAVNFGGSGYAVGDSLSASSSYLGGTSTVTFTITVSRADNRLYVNLNGNNVKFLASSGSPDYIEDDNASTNDHTFTAFGNAQLSTAQKKYGSASLLLDGTGDYISTGSSTDFEFDSGAWTIEAWVYNTGGQSAVQVLFDFRTATNQVVPYLNIQTNGSLLFYVNGISAITTSAGSIPLNTWTHVAVAKNNTSTKVFVNGTQSGSTYTDNNSYIQAPLVIGARYDGTLGFNGYIDDVRISKGVARYTTTFTAPTQQLTRQDAYTVLLLNFNGPNGTTNINYSDYVKTITDLTYYSNKTFNAASIGGGGNVDYSLSRITINSHGFSNGDPLYYYSGTNTAIGNLVSSSSYFAKVIDSNTIELYTNYNLSTHVTFGLTSTGTHNLSRYNVNIDNFFLVIPGHNYTTGTPVRITGSTPPGGLNDNEYAYIGSVTTNAFTLHASRADALASVTGITTAPLGLTSTGAGSLTFITQNVQINGTLNTSSKDAANWNNLTSTTIDASGIVSGIINPSRLGATGTANNQTFLRGDSSWAYATASAKPAADSPITITGDFDIRAGTNYYHGDLTFDVNHVDPTLGATYTNFGVVALNKSQFTLTPTGQVSITQGVVDAATLGGFAGSYYLTPSNFIAQVPITKGGTNLTTYSKGDILFAPSTNTLAQLNIGSTGQVLNVDATGIPAWSDNANLPGYLNVQSTTQSNLTTNGSIVTAGGVGIAKNINVGGTAVIGSDTTVNGALTANPANKNISLQPTGTGTVTINPNTTGAIDNVNIGATTQGTAKVTTLTASGDTKVTSNTSSTSTSTGALVVSGGVGVGENLNVYGNTVIGGNLTVNGTTTTVNSTTTTIEDPIIDIGGGINGAAPSTNDAKDRGIKFQWHNGTVAKTGFFGYKNADGFFEFIPDATITGEVASGTLGDFKAGTFRGNLVSSSVTITGGTINNTSVGATNASTGAFTTLTANDSVTFTKNTASTDTSTGTLVVTGGVGVSGAVNSGSVGTGALTATGNVTANGSNATISLQPTGTGTVTIKPNTTGALDNVTIGATTAKAGTFTDLTANTSVSMSPSGTVTINPTTAGTINNMSIGATTRGSGAFTSLAANGAVTFTQNTASSSTTTGTLVVTGGVGISGAVNIGSTINAGGATFTSVTDSGLTSGRITFAGTGGLLSDSSTLTYNTGTTTLTVPNLSVGTGITTAALTDSGLTSGQVVYAGTGGLLTTSSGLTFSSGTLTASTSVVVSGSAGDITMTGGNITGVLGITATGTIQGATIIDTGLTSGRVTFATTSGQLTDNSGFTFNSGTTTLTVTNASVGALTATTSASFSPSGTVTINPTVAGTINNMAIGGTTAAAGKFTSVTDTGLTSGRITFASTGGLLADSSSLTWDGTTLTAGAFTTTGALSAGATTVTTLSASGAVSITDSTQSTSTTTGALKVAGGVGIVKNLWVGGNGNVAGTFEVQSTLTADAAVNLNPANFSVSISPTGTGSATINPAATGTINNMSIGATTRSTGAFTTLDANSTVGLSPANNSVTISPTGTGTVTINPGTAGTINNMSIGASTAAAGRFTTLTATTSVTLSPSGAVTINPTTLGSIDNVNIGAGTAGTGAFTSLTASGATTFTSSTQSTNTTSGAVVVTGGVGIGKNLNVGGNLDVTGTTTAESTFSALAAVNLNPANYSVSIAPTGTGSVTVNPTVTGAIDNMVIGGTTAKAGTFTTLTSVDNLTATTAGKNVSLGASTGVGTTTINSGTTGSIDNIVIGGTTAKAGTFTALTVNTSASLSPTGSVTINPGTTSNINNVNIGATTAGTGKFTTLTSTGALSVTDTTQSTDSTTGSITTLGGLGVAKNANIGGNVVITGNLTVQGSTITVNSTVSTIEDPVIDIGGGINGAAPSSNDSKDRGITFQYYDTSAKRGFFGFDSATGYFKYIANASLTGEVASGTLGDIEAGNFRGNVVGGTGSFTTLSSSDVTSFTLTTDSSGIGSGAVRISGGTSVAKKLNVGGTAAFGLNSFNYLSISGSQSGDPVTINALGSDTSVNITLVPQGNQGIVAVNAVTALQIPVGLTTDRPTNPVNGLIRFNTTSTQFEGYNGVGWSSLGGVRDVASKTYIIPELTPGSHDKTLYFYAENSGGTSFQAGTWTSELLQINSPGFRVPTGNTSARPTGLYGDIRFNTDTLQFEGYDGTSWASLGGTRSQDGNTYIGATNGTLSFYASGTLEGTVTADGFNLGNIRITGNTVSAINTNGSVNLTANGTGVVKVTGTGAFQIPAGTTAQQPSGNPGYMRYNTDTRSLEVWDDTLGVYKAVGGGGVIDNAGVTKVTVTDNSNNDTNTIVFSVGSGTPGAPGQQSLPLVTINRANGLLVEGKISIHDNVIENITDNEDLIIRAKGTGRVVIDGSGSSSGVGNVFVTDPLLTFNSGLNGHNTYDSGFIINRSLDLNKGFIWSETAGEFRLVSTIEQGTVKGTVSVANYDNLAVASVKLNSETAGKVTFTDNSKIVRSLDSGRTAYVDGAMVFNSASQIALPVGTQAQRPQSPVAGSVRFNTDTQLWEGYAQGGWGQLGVGVGSAVDFQGFVADGTTHNFTMNQTPLGAASIIVAVNGVVQQPGSAYNVSGNVLQFQDAYGNLLTPDAGDLIDVRFLSKPAVGTIRTANYTGDGSTTHFASSIPITQSNEILVFVNNVWQDSAVYTVSGYDVIFSEPPVSGDRINLLHIAVVVAPNLITSAFHGFTRNANGDLLYTKLTTDEVMLRDGDGNELYTEKFIGTSDGNYSINSNGQLIYTYDGY